MHRGRILGDLVTLRPVGCFRGWLTLFGLLFATWLSQAGVTFTNCSLTTNGLVMSGAGGHSQGKFALLFTTNVAAGEASWWQCQTGSFDLAGSFQVTNGLPLSNAQGFYKVLRTVPNFEMVGFARLDGFASNGTYRAGGTTGGAGGPTVVASNLTWLVNYAQRSNMALKILVTSDIDCSSLNNNNPAPGYTTGRIDVNSDKTIYSTNGAVISRGTLRVSGKQNVIIRNLRFRDMWVYDPTGNYDTYGWDYVAIESNSHHVWVDHCDFEKVYDGMVDIKSGSDYVTVSWNVFRDQKKCSLIGSSDTDTGDRGHLNVTFHHNLYDNASERTPRMRFGNAHVYNLYFRGGTNAAGKCIQSTCEAATLVENVYFTQATNAYPTVYVNGGVQGNALLVTGSIITNSPLNHGFAQLNGTTFQFNSPFVTNRPPYNYSLDPLADLPERVTEWSGVGKLEPSDL